MSWVMRWLVQEQCSLTRSREREESGTASTAFDRLGERGKVPSVVSGDRGVGR